MRRWRAPAAVLLAVLLAVDVAHAVADGQLAGALPSAVGWALGGVTLVGLVRGARWAPYPLAITGVLLAVVDGLGDLGVLAHSQVSGGPAWLARLAAMAALGLGLAVAATGWQVWRREHPLPTAGGAATSPDPEPAARPARG
jgi:hypothetical protein